MTERTEPPEPSASSIEPLDESTLASGWGRERLARIAPDLIDTIGFARAPGALRSERLPAEVRTAFANLWDAIAAEVADQVRTAGTDTVRTRAGRKALWRRLERVLHEAQLLAIHLGHRHPLPTGQWGHRAGGSLGSGGVALGEQMVIGTSMVTGPTSALMVAVISAAMTQILEVYFVASTRMERYRFAARRPSAATLAADVGAIYTGGDVAPFAADRRIVEEAMRQMLARLIARSRWRFAELLALGVGPVVSGAMTGTIVTRAQRPPLREPDEIEREQPSS